VFVHELHTRGIEVPDQRPITILTSQKFADALVDLLLSVIGAAGDKDRAVWSAAQEALQRHSLSEVPDAFEQFFTYEYEPPKAHN
jgi:hypothetical protein